MKIAKRLFAAAIAVLMIAAMVVSSAAATIPTSANTLTVNGRAGFTAAVYKIADFDTTTGEFSDAKSEDVMTALKNGFTGTSYTPDAALLAAANALTDTQLGNATKSFAFNSTTTTKTWNDLAAGAYYVKWIVKPSNVIKAQNSVLVLPYYQNNEWIQSSVINVEDTKVDTGVISDDKKFADAAEQDSLVVTRSIGENVNFILTGTVPGSATTPATELWFDDTMGGGLKLNSSVAIAVSGTKDAGDPVALAVDTDYTLSSTDEMVRNFKISFTEAQIVALYNRSITGIQITYTAKLTDDEVVIAGDGNPNTMTYHYLNGADPYNHSVTKTVKTYQFQVKKVDANDSTKVLGKAKFQLYDENDTPIGTEKETPDTGANKGIVTFTGLKKGTYKVVETVAPDGYALNTKTFSVVIAPDGTVTGSDVEGGVLIVPDPKVVLPNTGGAGTLLFTIGGIALIAGAAVLLVIYKKKVSNK